VVSKWMRSCSNDITRDQKGGTHIDGATIFVRIDDS
jgi:hypothetical protein